jgi:hypothetical protein
MLSFFCHSLLRCLLRFLAENTFHAECRFTKKLALTRKTIILILSNYTSQIQTIPYKEALVSILLKVCDHTFLLVLNLVYCCSKGMVSLMLIPKLADNLDRDGLVSPGLYQLSCEEC